MTSRSLTRWATTAVLLAWSQVAAAQEPLPTPPLYLNSRTVILSARPENGVELDRVRVWFSTDDGLAWHAADVESNHGSSVRFTAPADGKYWFYVVLENQAGASAPPPISGSRPHVAVLLDTVPPTMQIHAARPASSTSGKSLIRLSVSLIEEHLGEHGLRVFYREPGAAAWRDGGCVSFAEGIVDWTPPAPVAPVCDLRLVATDLAGNQARDEIRSVALAPEPPAAPPAQQEEAPASVPVAALSQEERSPAVAGLDPVTIEPVPPVTLIEPTAAPPASQPSPSDAARSRLLRQQAARFLAEGRFALAGARLREALDLAPEDPDLLVDLGSVLYRTGQYDEAYLRFQTAAAHSPEHLGALEGLALVAATQKRYPLAHTHLTRLLELSPQSGEHWLHLGDVEHMLGNLAAARAAWEKALDLARSDKDLRHKVAKRMSLFGQMPEDAEGTAPAAPRR